MTNQQGGEHHSHLLYSIISAIKAFAGQSVVHDYRLENKEENFFFSPEGSDKFMWAGWRISNLPNIPSVVLTRRSKPFRS